MTEMTIEARRPFSTLTMLLLLTTGVLAVLSIVNKDAVLAFIGVIPLGPVPFLVWRGPRAVRVKVHGEGLEVEHPYQHIRWEDVQTIRRVLVRQNPAKKSAGRDGLEILHTGGSLRLPAKCDPRQEELFSSLLNALPVSGSRKVPASLASHLADEEARFGPDLVYTYRARAYLGTTVGLESFALGVGLYLGILLAWILYAVMTRVGLFQDALHETLSLLGMASAMIGLFALFPLILWLGSASSQPNKGIKHWRRAGIVISPAGLAMSQGRMEGELKWSDINTVSFQRRTRDGIVIDVTGAKISIFDIYDRPMYTIYRRIMKYWKNQDV